MKTLPLTAIAAVVFTINTATAQSGRQRSNYWFIAEGRNTFQVANCLPSSYVAFYSRPDGGRQLKIARADEQGVLRFSADQTFRPAMVVNHKAQGGNDAVSQLGNPDFELSRLQLEQYSGTVTISWHAVTQKDKAIVYEVLRSTDGSAYEAVAAFNGAESSNEESYSYRGPAGIINTRYKVNVRQGDDPSRYCSRELLLNTTLRLYPTQVTNELHADVNLLNATTAHYRVISSNGQTLSTGILENGQNAIPVSGLPPGNYLVVATTGSTHLTQKFVRL